MTALEKFERLECTGIWRAAPEAQRRDVLVSIGDATLVITDLQDTALAHWSLPAVERTNPGERPAIFCPGTDATEFLEIDDETMIGAIAKVQNAIRRRRPHPGRLRHLIIATGTAVTLAIAIFWLPNAMIRYTASVVPTASRILIGHSLLDGIRRVTGEPCSAVNGDRALVKLQRQLLDGSYQSLRVMPGGLRDTTHLPGGIILLNRNLVEDSEEPEVVAGYILAEDQRARQRDPLLEMLHTTGLRAALRLLTTGEMDAASLNSYGEQLLTVEKVALPDEALLARFKDVGIRSSPYAYATDISGETTVGLIEADPMAGQETKTLLSDGDWIGLQQICGE